MLNLQRLRSMIRKEFLQHLRDPQTLRIMAAAPLIQLVVLGFALNNDPKDLRVGILDMDRSQTSREVVESLRHTGYFIVHAVESPGQLMPELDSGRSQATLQIPPDFSRKLARGEVATVQLMADGSDTNSATLMMAYVSGTVRGYAGTIQADWYERRGHKPSGINISRRVWYNPALRSRDFILPGVVALLITILASSLTVLSIARERELGTLEQILVTPLSSWEFMFGKMIPPAVLSFAMAVPVAALSVLLFRVPFRGNVLFLAVAIIPFVLSALSVGLLLSAVAHTQQQAQLLNFFYNLPQMLLSGFIFPIATMPVWAQCLSAVVPQRYFLVIVRGVYLKGVGLAILWPQLLALCALAGALFLAGVLLFRRRLD